MIIENDFFNNNLYADDSKFKEWDSISLATLYDFWHEGLELELKYITAYLDAARVLLSEMYIRRNLLRRVDDYDDYVNLCVPFLYMCEHVIELSIKYKMRDKKNGRFMAQHGLTSLWRELPKNVTDDINEKYIKLMESLDVINQCSNNRQNNHALRYPYAKNGSENNNGLLRMNTIEIFNTTKRLFGYLVFERQL